MSDMERRKLGDMLLDAKLITKEQLEEGLALRGEGEGNDPIGEVLVNMGYLSEEGLARTLSKQLN